MLFLFLLMLMLLRGGSHDQEGSFLPFLALMSSLPSLCPCFPSLTPLDGCLPPSFLGPAQTKQGKAKLTWENNRGPSSGEQWQADQGCSKKERKKEALGLA